MRKLILLLCLLVSVIAEGRKIPESEAAAIASKFLNSTAVNRVLLKPTDVKRANDKLTTSENEMTPYYVFNGEDGKGFVIVSGDDRAKKILGYSDKGSFNVENVPPQLAWLLDEYRKEITRYPQSYAIVQNSEMTDREKIEPLLTTKWGQGFPYNKNYPIIDGIQAPAGCVATALAQVINFHQWPLTGEDVFSYTWENDTFSVDYDKEVYNWNNLIDTYNTESTESSCNEVANLFYDCAVGLEMYYTQWASGSGISQAKRFLVENMKYDADAKIVWRHNYSYKGWLDLIYEELSQNRPVYMEGGSHAFVCDGYDDDEYFHFNWGWGGDFDGYFVFTTLMPHDENYARGGMHALINVHKRIGEKRPFTYDLYCCGSLKYNDEKIISENIYNYSRKDFTGMLGVVAINVENNESEFIGLYQGIVGAEPGGLGVFHNCVSFGAYDMISLHQGSYRLLLAFSDDNVNYTLIPCLYGGQSFIELTVDENGVKTFKNPGYDFIPNIEISDFHFSWAGDEPHEVTECNTPKDGSFGVDYLVNNKNDYAIPFPTTVITNQIGEEVERGDITFGVFDPNSIGRGGFGMMTQSPLYMRNGKHYVSVYDFAGNQLNTPYEFTIVGSELDVPKIEDVTSGHIYNYISDGPKRYNRHDLYLKAESEWNNMGSICKFDFIKDGELYYEGRAGVDFHHDTKRFVEILSPIGKPLYGDYKLEIYDCYGVKLHDEPFDISFTTPPYELTCYVPEKMSVGEEIVLQCGIKSCSWDDGSLYHPGLEWSSSNPNIADFIGYQTHEQPGGISSQSLHSEVYETVVLKTISPGITTVTVRPLDESDRSISYDIEVIRPIESISLNPQEIILHRGDEYAINAEIFPENVTDKSLIWSSSDETVAEVSSTGAVTAIGIGECYITVTATDGSGVTATCYVTVNPIMVESLTIDPESWSSTESDAFQISAEVQPENATDKTIVWTSSDETVATVDANGMVTVLKVGSCVITASTVDGSNLTAECIITCTTAIDDLFADGVKVDVYNTGGVLLKRNCSKKDLKALAPGVYIINGKKVVIR